MSFEENKTMDESRQGEVLVKESAVVNPDAKKLYLESYGCAMNFSDSEIVASIMTDLGFITTSTTEDADVIFLNTCAIRDNAELRIWARLKDFKKKKVHKPSLIIGVLGCMAERLKTKLLEQEKLVDLVVGPDSYRDLGNLITSVESGQKAVNVLLSREETYAEISPVRLGSNGISAFISITRGCDNMCSFCVVPFTRGRERSRDPESILNEARQLFESGYKEITLLGQNVDSYVWHPDTNTKKEIYKRTGETGNAGNGRMGEQEKHGEDHRFEYTDTVTFAGLLGMVAEISPELRVRFSTSNPRDMTDAVLDVMKKHDNICKYIHLPVQSGSSEMLERMNRGYSREDYIRRIEKIREVLPGCGISTDIITGFCGETEEEHRDTLSLMEWAGYEYAYMFKYSERPGTQAARQFTDDIPEKVKAARLSEIISLQSKLSHQSNLKDLNKTFRVLVDSVSKRSKNHLSGRNDQNKVVIFPREKNRPGDYVNVLVTDCTPATLLGHVI
ncbi:MAG: MiaB/RimO family radical SAM methylthiotransferase [Bacteroidetes bacterium]|nr:MiaB/RimO family radical SAM methylthiotransferase [Bacteroidota bacterium]